MNNNYFRITAYNPQKDRSVIMDSPGHFEQLWQLSSLLVMKDFQIIEIADANKFLDGDLPKVKEDKNFLILQAYGRGKPGNIVLEHENVVYHALKVGEKAYIPNKAKPYEFDEGGAE